MFAESKVPVSLPVNEKIKFLISGMLFSIMPNRLDVDIPFTFTRTSNCQRQGNKNPIPFLTHPRKTKELSETKTSFLFLDIFHLQQIFHLNIGIWFLEIQRRDNFFSKVKLLVENKHSHLSRARNKFLFPFIEMRDQD